MRHLSRAELVDLVELSPALSEERVRHAAACASCAAAADRLSSTLAEAARDEVPEPSPLFWDHFSARVSDAVRGATPDADSGYAGGWIRSPLTSWAMAGTMAVLLILTVVWRTTLYAPVPAAGPSMTASAAGTTPPPAAASSPADAGTDVDDDTAWAIVRAAADGLPWEDAHAAGLSAGPGSAEGLALEMSADERSELARLLGEELKRNGA